MRWVVFVGEKILASPARLYVTIIDELSSVHLHDMNVKWSQYEGFLSHTVIEWMSKTHIAAANLQYSGSKYSTTMQYNLVWKDTYWCKLIFSHCILSKQIKTWQISDYGPIPMSTLTDLQTLRRVPAKSGRADSLSPLYTLSISLHFCRPLWALAASSAQALTRWHQLSLWGFRA